MPSRGGAAPHSLWLVEGIRIIYPELDAIGNVRHVHAGVDPAIPTFTGDLGFSYSAFGKSLALSDPGGIAPPMDIAVPFQWQGKRIIGSNLYDSRARVWSADLGAFLQPDEYGFLTRGGTLWSWPGQDPVRWRDPSGRYAGGLAGAAAAGGEIGAATLGAGLLAAGIVGYAGWNIYNQFQDFYHPIISHAAVNNKGSAAPSDACKTESSGNGSKLPPAAGGAVAADDDDGWSERRAGELKSMMPAGAQGFITMAAGTARDPVSGEIVRIVGTSEPNGYLRPGVMLEEGEVLANGTGHAEQNIAAYARANGLDLIEFAATRPICPACMQATYSGGGIPLGPLRLKP